MNKKYYLKYNMEEAVSSLLYYGGSDDAMGLSFENPKPVYIAKKLIYNICKGKDDIVMDFFSGSRVIIMTMADSNDEYWALSPLLEERNLNWCVF